MALIIDGTDNIKKNIKKMEKLNNLLTNYRFNAINFITPLFYSNTRREDICKERYTKLNKKEEV